MPIADGKGRGKEKDGRRQGQVKKPPSTSQIRRLRTGCLTCRVRHVKCDEARPNCSRCESTGRICDGYSAVPVTRTQISQSLRNGSSLTLLRNPAGLFDNDREGHCFEFFRSFAAPKSTIFFGSNFWLQRVPQMSHSEPAIKDATLALSSLHRYYEFEQLPQSGQDRRSAIFYYSRAVSQTKGLLSQNTRMNIEKLLVICLMFICYENLVGNFSTAQMHLQNGLRILSESRSPSEGQSIPQQAIPDDILHTFSRIDLETTVSRPDDSRAPHIFYTHPRSKPDPIPSSFSSIAEAQYHLFEHFKWRLIEEKRFHDLGVQIPPLRQSWLASQLTTWGTSFATLQLRQRDERSIAQIDNELVMTQIRYEMISNVDKDICLDVDYARYERILTLIESLPVVSGSGSATVREPLSQRTFSLEWGVIFPLYFISVKCRDPRLRRRALAYLYTLRRREGIWDSLSAARIAERVIEIKEEELKNGQTAKHTSKEEENFRRPVTHFAHLASLASRHDPWPDTPSSARKEICREEREKNMERFEEKMYV